MARSSLLPPRRTEGKRTQGRSAEVVQRVFEATAEELGRAGFDALRIEDVAQRSGVNKTTIYRRWPTKAELVAALLDHGYDPPVDFDTGTLFGDLQASLRDLRARLAKARERGFLQIIQAERVPPEVAAAVRRVRAQHREARRRLFDRAVQRGELPPDIDTQALVELVTAPIVTRMIHLGMGVDDTFIDLIAHVVCEGSKRLGTQAVLS
jgi:AcrR family transcriptional regulator